MAQQATPTLFVADLPSDVNETDLSDLFGGLDGYHTSRLRTDRSSRVVGFVDFHSADSAAAAKALLEERVQAGTVQPLRVQFAKASRGPAAGSAPPPAKRPREDEPMQPRMPPPAARVDARGGYAAQDASYDFDLTRQGLGLVRPVHGDPMMAQPALLAQQAHAPPVASAYDMRQPAGFYGATSEVLATAAVPPEASSTLYVENVPADATQRELSHIFRPFPGYQSIRLIPKELRRPTDTKRWLCFVEFDNKFQALAARNQVQGYRMDKTDTRGLGVDFAKQQSRPQPPPGGGQAPRADDPQPLDMRDRERDSRLRGGERDYQGDQRDDRWDDRARDRDRDRDDRGRGRRFDERDDASGASEDAMGGGGAPYQDSDARQDENGAGHQQPRERRRGRWGSLGDARSADGQQSVQLGGYAHQPSADQHRDATRSPSAVRTGDGGDSNQPMAESLPFAFADED